jgi:hypothetical protein
VSGQRHSLDRRVAIEQGIARGEDDHTIASRTGASMRGVAAVRRALDDMADADVFAATKQHARRTHCFRNHPLTPDNVKDNGAGKRECRTCSRERERERSARRRTGHAA